MTFAPASARWVSPAFRHSWPSGNVIFDAPQHASAEFAAHVEEELRSSLGYEVPTFLRTADEVRAIAAHEVFSEELERSGGKVQVALLRGEPV